MNLKKVMVILLVLFAVATVALFAGELKGVSWYTSGDQTYITNNNDYRVRVEVARVGMGGSISQGLDAGETKTYNGAREVIAVMRIGN